MSNVLERLDAARVDRLAFVIGESRITYGALRARASCVAAGLRAHGLGPGDRVVVMIPMSVELYETLMAVLEVGAVAVFVDPWVGARTIAAFASFAEPAAFVGVPRSHLLRLLERGLRRIPLSVTTGGRIGPLPARRTLYELRATPPLGSGPHPARPEEPALVTFTTGSTGIPKGANRTHGFLAAQGAALRAAFPYEDADVDMPMFPVFALNNLAQGLTSVVPDMDFRRPAEVDGARIARQMWEHGVTTCTASPPFFDRLCAHVASRPGQRPALRRILTGGAPVLDEQLRAWRAALPRTEIVVAYGSTEAEPVAHISAEERLAESETARGFCAGRPMDAVRTRLVRITGGAIEVGAEGWGPWEVPPGEVGELIVCGEHVCREYFRNPAAEAENKIAAFGEVWHRMGDTGYFDERGRFWLVGRVHSTIRRRGVDVHPQLIEQAARRGDPRIRQVAAVGLPSGAEEDVVVVVRADAPADDVERRVAQSLAAATLPCDRIVVTGRPLPVDPRHNSKIDYPRVRALVASR